ncbi:hypothetical protein FXO37_35287 [Capsicum annuum]|nr:hypothetical protein FXO37_35287 [Capsicum annuum]
MNRYYPGMDKVMRYVVYDDFVNKKIAFRDEDLYEIELLYFVSRFLQSELPRKFIKKVDFDLVESVNYLKYDWGGFQRNDRISEEDIEWNREASYIDNSMNEPLEYVIVKYAPQHGPQSKYGAQLGDYARWKQNDGAISQSETTRNITSEHVGFKRSSKAFLKVQEHDNTSQKTRLQQTFLLCSCVFYGCFVI